MGKGTIISGGDKGQYTIDIVYNSAAYDREIALLDQQIADLQIKYDNAPETTAEEKIAKSILKLQLTSLNKRKENLQSAYSGSTQKTVWCADLTEDLSGNVGTIEVPGESTNMQIQPGYESNANYDSNRDGQLQLSYNMDYAGLFYNLAMLPGWQKWKPLFRYGTITAINNDLANVTLEDIKSSQQAISINQTNTLTGVEFEYMTCDGAAFSEGDEVLIKFEGQDWTKPKIIGFRDNPKRCGNYIRFNVGDKFLLWDVINKSPKVFTEGSNPGSFADMEKAGFGGSGEIGTSYVVNTVAQGEVYKYLGVTCYCKFCDDSCFNSISGTLDNDYINPAMSLDGEGSISQTSGCDYDENHKLITMTKSTESSATQVLAFFFYTCNGYIRSGGQVTKVTGSTDKIWRYKEQPFYNDKITSSIKNKNFFPIGEPYDSIPTIVDYTSETNSKTNIVSWENSSDKVFNTRQANYQISKRNSRKSVYYQVYIQAFNNITYTAQSGSGSFMALYSEQIIGHWSWKVRSSAHVPGQIDPEITTDDINPFEDSDMPALSGHLETMINDFGDDFKGSDFEAVFF